MKTLTLPELEILLGSTVTSREIFDLLQTRLQVDHFNEAERIYAAFWGALQSFFDQYRRLPTEMEFFGDLENHVTNAYPLSPDEYADLQEFLSAAYSMKDKDISIEVAASYLQRFLLHRVSVEVQNALQSGLHEDISAYLRKMAERAAAASNVQDQAIADPFPDGWGVTKKVLKKVPFGTDFFDRFLCGGGVAGEVYGILGPYGGGKTTAGIQLSIGLARHYANVWRRSRKKKPLGRVYIFVYEDPPDLIRCRALSHAANINRGLLEAGGTVRLSRPGQLSERDKLFYSDAYRSGLKVFSELERRDMALSQLKLNWRFQDMIGYEEENISNRGGGWMAEIQQIIKADLAAAEKQGQEVFCGGIVVDYIGAAAKRFCEVNGLSYSNELRHLIGTCGLYAKNYLAVPFKCPTILLHQLNADSNGFPPGIVPHHSKAAEAHNFAENLDFCFCIGTQDDNARCIFSCSKHRRAPGMPYEILHMDGAYGTLRDTYGQYVVNPKRKSIVEVPEHMRQSPDEDLQPVYTEEDW